MDNDYTAVRVGAILSSAVAVLVTIKRCSDRTGEIAGMREVLEQNDGLDVKIDVLRTIGDYLVFNSDDHLSLFETCKEKHPQLSNRGTR